MENLLKLSVKNENELKKEAKKAVCALLNSNGGKLIINTELKKGKVIRLVEQSCESFLNTSGINEKLILKRSTKPNQYIWEVKRGDALCTTNYNLYLPTDAQKKLINPLDFKAVNKILDTGRIVDVTPTNQDVPARFILKDSIGIDESRTVQFKHLKSEKEGGSDLASRIVSNDLTHYVSAFANDCGGRIYYGIDDEGKVQGQKVKDKDQEDVTRKISNIINEKMIWPEYCGETKRGRDGQWDISFEPVKDEQGNPIQSTFVIEIFIAACPGGVFTSKPESYHIVNGEVPSMTFAEWKRKYLDSARELETNKALRLLPKCYWSSMKLKLTCDSLDWELLRMINNGQWNKFTAFVTKLQNDTQDGEVRLVLLTKRFMFHYRKGEYEAAHNCMAEFDNRLPTAKDFLIFYVKGRLVRSAMERSSDNHNESYKIAKDCLQQVEQIAPCISTAEFYVHFGTMLTIMESSKDSHDLSEEDLTEDSFKHDAILFFDRALQHLHEADYVPSSKADKQQKTLIHLAFLHLGCSLSGGVVNQLVSEDDIKKAKTCIDQARDSALESTPMSSFRECHLDFAESCFYYRRSQLEPSKEKRIDWLERALRKVAEAHARATLYQFVELSRYAKNHTKVFEKELETL